jgi:dCTP deaminase
MTILSAQTIRHRCVNGNMISPFHERTVCGGKTFGLSSAGYDVRVALKIGMMHRFHDSKWCETAGNRFLLAATMERFAMPKDVMGVVHDKSSWARRGLTVQNTVIEPGWRGYLTLELIYHGEDELIICYEDPIAQIVFHRLDETTDQPYSGKYQNQEYGPQEAREETP